jgi:cation diffusion facilitator family transporter
VWSTWTATSSASPKFDSSRYVGSGAEIAGLAAGVAAADIHLHSCAHVRLVAYREAPTIVRRLWSGAMTSHTHDEHEPHGHAHEHDGHSHSHEPHHHGHDHGHRGGVVGVIRHWLSPHNHDHADAIDTATANREGMRALAISLAALGATAVLQVVIVAVSGSVALLADTIHNFSDALTAIPIGVAFWLGRRPPDQRYTYGYGRAEDLAGVFVVAVITLSAVVAGWQAVERLIEPRTIDQPGWVALAGLVGFAGNELVAHYRIRVGRRIGSAALVADGLHARTDGFTSLAVLGAALGAMVGWRQADPLIGLAISVAIFNVLRYAARDIYRRLMDRVDPELVERITHDLGHVTGVASVDRVRVRWIGHELHADAEVALTPALTLVEVHDVLEEARHRLLHSIPRLADVLLHPNPAGTPDAHQRTAHHWAPAT